MPHSPLDDLPAALRERAARIRLAAFDVDGVLTDGRLSFDASGLETKHFHTLDGQGIKLLAALGIEVAWITARSSEIVARRAAELGVTEVHQGVKDKLACLRRVCEPRGIALDEVAYTGDDLPDLSPMQHCGLAVAPANAHPWVKARVHWRTQAAGGDGAVREVCDLLLAAQGKAEAALALFIADAGAALVQP